MRSKAHSALTATLILKGAMNAAHLCKLRNGVKKCLNFFFFQWPKVDQVRNEYSPQLSKLMA
jgi:hypothetical protein